MINNKNMKTKIFTLLVSLFSFSISKAQLKIGQNYQDGIIISLSADGKSGLLIQKKDFSKSMDWHTAKNECGKLGPGWRLPKLEELRILRDHKNKFHFKPDYSYWSGEESDRLKSCAWGLSFRGIRGPQDYGFVSDKDGKDDITGKQLINWGTKFVRAVKSF